MDWPLAISRNRDALLSLVSTLVASVGLGATGLVARLPKPVYLAVLHVLRPAESAARRLIVIAAEVNAMNGVTVAARPVRLAPSGPIPRSGNKRIPVFPLFDTRKNFGLAGTPRVTAAEPRIGVPGFYDAPLPRKSETTPEPEPDVSAEQLSRRLLSLQRALETLPAQAKRLARLRPRRKLSPLRPGQPPGHRDRGKHPVDALLSNCHELALHALHPPDTS